LTQTLRIRGIEAEGRHGASAGERDAPQPLTVDLEIEVEPGGDDIDHTADYREIVASARSVITDQSHTLIETIARQVAETVAELPRVRSCRVVVHKPAAADRLDIDDVSAEAVAARGAAP
jgi:dihydroneopterin aldolase